MIGWKKNKEKYIDVLFKVVDKLNDKEIIKNKELVTQMNKFLPNRYKINTHQLPFLLKYQRKYKFFKSIYGHGMIISYIFVEVRK